MMYNIINIAMDIFDIIVIIMFFKNFFTWKSQNVLKCFSCYAVMLIAVLFNDYLVTDKVFTIILSLAIFFIASLWFDSGIKRKIFVIIGYMILVIAGDFITTLIMTSIFNSAVNTLLNVAGNDRIIAMIISKPVILCLVKITGLFANKENIYTQGKYWFAMLTIPIVNIVLLVSIVHLFDNVQINNMSFVYIASICILYTTLLAFYLFDRIMNMGILKNRCDILENQVVIQSTQARKNEDDSKRIDRIRHDLKLHFQLLYNLLCDNQYDIAKKHLKDSGMVTNISCNMVHTGNIALDSILNTKIEEANTKGIETQISCRVPNDLKITEFDICSLFGNLLDNAIEGCLRSENPNKKINIIIRYDINRLSCCIQNTAYSDIKKDGEFFISNKDGGNRYGIGTRNIQDIVLKYDGICKMSYKDNLFISALTLFNV